MSPINKRRILWSVISGFVLIVPLVLAVPLLNLFHAHEHCIKMAGSDLMVYAHEHYGRFPFHTNGFGDAILLLLRDSWPNEARVFTAPGDDTHLLKECLRTGKHMPEECCSRAYVQGLCETNDPRIALVFDRYPTRGGDHFRCPWGRPLREVILLDGSMQTVPEVRWPAFRQEQIELLVNAGFTKAAAEKLYSTPPECRPRK